jgi:hypothetical protein
MESSGLKHSPEAERANPSDWRSWLLNKEGLSQDSADLMDQIAGLMSAEDIENKFQEICAIQKEGDRINGTEVKPREGFKISAMIQLAQERGIITPEEEQKLRHTIEFRA